MRLIPKERKFFRMFRDVSENLTEGARLLHDILKNPDDLAQRINKLQEIEHRGDDMTHDIIRMLNQTFITPFDREDIHELASNLDDVMDAMDGTARRTQIFRLGASPQGVLRLVDVLQKMMGVLAEAVSRLKKGDDVMRYCVEAKQLEEEGDSIYHEALGQLFEKERDAIELIKWKEIYDNLEGTLDQAEDVANVVESITIKHA